MLGTKDVQGARVCQYVSRSAKETQRRTNKRVNKSGLYLFQKGNSRHTNNRSQYMPSKIVCQVIMYVNAFNQGVLGLVRDYMHANTF